MSDKRVNNPLANRATAEDAIKSLVGEVPTEEKKTLGRPKREDLQRGGAVEGLPVNWTRSTFIVNESLLEELKDYAYTERVNIKDVVEQMMEEFLCDKRDKIIKRK